MQIFTKQGGDYCNHIFRPAWGYIYAVLYSADKKPLHFEKWPGTLYMAVNFLYVPDIHVPKQNLYLWWSDYTLEKC